ncbi:MAG: fibronectin type III domain-containing protein [Treponema sp.]|nr:fibronectin type III domain-containing protein [Treponema sp.]
MGEKIISLGGASGWNLAENREGVTEAVRIRPHPVLVLSSAGATAGTKALVGYETPVQTLDLTLSFDEERPAFFTDRLARYQVKVSSAPKAVDYRWARMGTGAVLFPGNAAVFSLASNPGGGADRSGGVRAPLVIEARSRDALFAPGSHIRDFSLEFWLYPMNLENGEQILSWISSSPLSAAGGDGTAAGAQSGGAASGQSRRDYAFQRIQCVVARNRLQWSFLDFFASPDGKKHLDINLAGDTPVIPKSWSHHLIRFDSDIGAIEYLVNGETQALDYASSTRREGGEVFTPVVGEGGSFVLGGGFTGLMDEFRIHGVRIGSPSTQKYPSPGGRVETRAVDLGEGNSGILKIDVFGGRTTIRGGRVRSEYRNRGRFLFSDDSEIQFFVRAADNPYRWDDTDWLTFTPGTDLAGNIRGRYVQLAADFYPSGDAETSPYLEEIRIVYQPDEAPLPPPTLTAAAGDGGVRLSWKSSPDSDTAGYLVYYGEARGEYFGENAAPGASPINAGKRNSLFVEGLKNGVLYYFAVAAYDRGNPEGPAGTVPRASAAFHAGEFSREVSARPLAGLSVN